MTDYTKTTDFAAKDALLTGNPSKVVLGSEIDTEFTNIATAVATKMDNPFTTRGDVLVRGAATEERLALGAAGEILRSDGTDVTWSTVPVQSTVDSVATQTESAFTSIPAWVTEIEVSMSGITTNGTNVPGIQLGDSGGYETSGYTGAVSTLLAASTGVNNLSSAFDLTSSWSAATVVSGSYVLTLIDAAANLWALRGGVGSVNTAAVSVTFGTKSLTAPLDRVRVVMDGVDVFDGSGKINISYK